MRTQNEQGQRGLLYPKVCVWKPHQNLLDLLGRIAWILVGSSKWMCFWKVNPGFAYHSIFQDFRQYFVNIVTFTLICKTNDFEHIFTKYQQNWKHYEKKKGAINWIKIAKLGKNPDKNLFIPLYFLIFIFTFLAV